MVLRTEHVNSSFFQPALGYMQRVHVRYFEGDMVDPVRRFAIPFSGRRGWQVEERNVAAIMTFEENVNEVNFLTVWLVPLGRYFACGVFQPEHLGVEIDRLLRVAAAIGDVVQFLKHRSLL